MKRHKYYVFDKITEKKYMYFCYCEEEVWYKFSIKNKLSTTDYEKIIEFNKRYDIYLGV